MAVRTFARYLLEKGMVDWFRNGVAPHLKYLRSVIGDAFFTDVEKEGFATKTGHESLVQSLTARLGGDSTGKEPPYLLLDSEYGRYTVVASHSHDWEGGWMADENAVADHNAGILSHHFQAIESHLLGSRGVNTETCHDGNPVPGRKILPFCALLGKKQVSLGEGGRAGGFDPGNPMRPYRTPIDGVDRPLPIRELNEKIEELSLLVGTPDSGRILLTGMPFGVLPHALNRGDRSIFGVCYAGVDEFLPQLPFATSRFMPRNALYIIAPEMVCIHAYPLGEVTTNETDKIITKVETRLAHSLLHHRDLEALRLQPDGFQWEMEKYHHAFLAVRRPREGDLDPGDSES